MMVIGGILEDTIHSTDSETGDILEDTIIQSNSKTGSIQTQENVRHISCHVVISESYSDFVVNTFHNSYSDIGEIIDNNIEIILGDASGLLQQAFPLYSAELGNNIHNTQEASDSILTDSAANLVENDMASTSTSLTVNTKLEMEDTDMTTDPTTQNNPDVYPLISSFPYTPIIISSKTEEGETHPITFTHL